MMGWESDLWGRKVPQSPGNDALRCFNDGLFGQWGWAGRSNEERTEHVESCWFKRPRHWLTHKMDYRVTTDY